MRYRIGEFAELGGVSTKTLRFYDRIGLLRPASADPRTRYRFYVPEQLLDLATILSLKDLGANLHGIQQLIQSGKSPQARKRLLQTLRDSLSQTIADQACLLQNIEQALRDADGGSPEIPVVVKRRPPIWIASIRARVSSYAEMTQHETTLTSSLPPETIGDTRGTIWHRCADSGLLEGEPFVEIRYRSAPKGSYNIRQLPSAIVASAYSEQDEAEAENAYDAIRAWMRSRNYILAGPKREIDLGNLLEIQFPLHGV